MIETIKIILKRWLVETWMLKTILVRAQKEVKSIVEKASIILENTDCHEQMLVEI